MRQLLNTLFVTSEDIYLSLDGENIVANRGGEAVARYPLHTLQNIVTFSYAGASPALMGKCAQREIGLAFCSPRGKFLARVSGQMQGNVLLRRMQYRVADDPSQSCRIARNMVFGKVFNARWSVERTRRDHVQRIDDVRFSSVSAQLQGLLPQITEETSPDSLRACTRLRIGSRKRGAGRVCWLSPPRPPRAGVSGARSDGGVASLLCRPLCAHAHQQPYHEARRF